MIPIILYTHSEYSFIWKATIPLLEKYASDYIIHWCSDDLLDVTLPSKFIYHKYDASLNWSSRIKDCVEKINSEHFMYIQEDWLLTNYIDKDKVSYIVEFMKDNNVDFIMSYIRGNTSNSIKSKYDNYEFRKIVGHYMQPAIWKKTLFTKIINLNVSLSEYEGSRVNHITNNANCYAIVYTKTKDVSIPTLYFPHMHAICGGKWVFIRYPQLKSLIESYGIDTTTRGICRDWILDYQ